MEIANSKKSRINWIDMAKGYGILLVILGHLGVGKLGLWKYTFHMPLFFFLSGYVFSIKYDFITFLKRKCKSILLPYFALGIPMIIFQFIWECFYEKNNIDFVNLFLEFIIQRRFLTLWYLACLFWLNIIFYCLVKWCRSLYKILIISFMLFLLGLTYYRLGGVSLPWNVDVCFTAVLFFSMGYFLKTIMYFFKNYFIKNNQYSFFLLH